MMIGEKKEKEKDLVIIDMMKISAAKILKKEKEEKLVLLAVDDMFDITYTNL